MLRDVSVKLPNIGDIEKALIELLRARGNRPLTASEAYRMLANHFKLDWKQRNVKSATRDALKWHDHCRSAREHLAKRNIMPREPRDSWALTDFYFRHPGGIAFDDDGGDVDF